MVRSIGKIFNNRFFIFIAIVTLTVDFMYLTYNQWKPDHNRDDNDYDDNVETIKINNDELPSNTEIYSNNNENIEDDFDDDFVFKKRPREDYMIDLNNILENCDMNKKYIHECLKYLGEQESDYMVPKLANNDSSENELMLFHVYWKGAINDKLSLMIKSFLYTQKLDNSKLYIWMYKINEDLNRNHYSKELLHFSPKYIEFKEWNTEKQLTKNNLYSGWEKILMGHVGTVSFSDLVRFVVLHNYGGIYIDADVLLLRDMSPLYNSGFEFSYRWSYLEDYNTAVLRLRANSTTSRKIIEGAMKNQMNFHPFAVKNYLLSSQSFLENEGNIDTMSELNKNLYMLPVPLFDPLWLKKDKVQIDNLITPNLSNFSDVFEVELLEDEFPHTAITDNVDKNSIEEDENDDDYNLDYNLNHQDLIIKLRKPHRFFSGAFTYHWHNNWKTKILPTSWFGILKKSYDRFLSGNGPNLYNEYFPINKIK